MKTDTLLEIVFKRMLRNRKRNRIILIPIVVLSILMFFANMIQYSMKSYINSIEDNIELKTIGIQYNPQQYDYYMEKLSKIEHIDMITDQYENRIMATLKCEQLIKGNTDGTIFEEAVNEKTCPDVLSGKKISDFDEYVVVIPSKLYADSNFRTYKEPILENEYINRKYFIKYKYINADKRR